jgi:catechol 2,3-dioxygenase-like lactoylglutathione lyase family enzyme
MKRMHVHIGVESLDQSIKFYSALFGSAPTKTKPDYAKWMLDDPRLNFAISTRAGTTGVDHLGLQVDEDEELEGLRERLRRADTSLFNEGETVCCYARSEKSWVTDPSGVAWETYRTMAEARAYTSDGASTGAGAGNVPKSQGRTDAATVGARSCC